MKILDDMSCKKESIDDVIGWLQKAKEQGDTVLKVDYELVGYEQAMIIVTAKE